MHLESGGHAASGARLVTRPKEPARRELVAALLEVLTLRLGLLGWKLLFEGLRRGTPPVGEILPAEEHDEEP